MKDGKSLILVDVPYRILKMNGKHTFTCKDPYQMLKAEIYKESQLIIK